ncbi:hypothetical protein GZH47_11280 [Paenibacillus rhizovicinus]|uniref:Uncharacterized protein n=1 Tax=Paenibacillus rhizovicinus TaxID=2704463 RepID=A0A6C0NZK2_9BACL|nr:hypothetical protein [Paenibacillus rhizovicinus]QHW31366.1 hypothetical protein GZH47_11280 [Paenibacillus rhizovicinus]
MQAAQAEQNGRTKVFLQERMDSTRIARVECFRFDGEAARLLVPGCGSGDCCGMVKLSAAEGDWGAGVFRECRLKGDFVQWACAFQRVKRATLAEGLREALLKQESWGNARTAAFLMALQALASGSAFRSGTGAAGPLPASFGDPAYCFRHAEAYVIF